MQHRTTTELTVAQSSDKADLTECSLSDTERMVKLQHKRSDALN